MIEIVEALTRRQQRDFLDFPNRLFKDNPSYVPPLYLDEKKIFRKDYLYYETCEAVYYTAYKDGVMAGRISGILQKAANEKMNQKRIRFIRFDCIEDFEVAKALFEKVEAWARSKGMDTVHGPLGFSDLEREGLLVEGFDEPETFEEQYNPPYYAEFIERRRYRQICNFPVRRNFFRNAASRRVNKLVKLELVFRQKFLDAYRLANIFRQPNFAAMRIFY